jgi:hypothetical protein
LFVEVKSQDAEQTKRAPRDHRLLVPAAPEEPGSLDRLIVSTVAKVDPAKARASLKHLVSFPTRHTFSRHNVDAAQWLENQLRSMGYDHVSLHDFHIRSATRHNVICVKPGIGAPNKVVIIGAHFDSRMKDLDDARSVAPGGDDNGSGVAALLEAARVLRGLDLTWTIQFCAFAGEEQGLIGSAAYARFVHKEGLPVYLVLNVDMVGHPQDLSRPVIVVERDIGNRRRDNDAASRGFAAQMTRAARFTKLGVKEGPIYGSDYMPFEQLGIACIGLFDGADNQPFYHDSTDGLGTVDVNYCAEATRLIVATVLDVTSRP